MEMHHAFDKLHILQPNRYFSFILGHQKYCFSVIFYFTIQKLSKWNLINAESRRNTAKIIISPWNKHPFCAVKSALNPGPTFIVNCNKFNKSHCLVFLFTIFCLNIAGHDCRVFTLPMVESSSLNLSFREGKSAQFLWLGTHLISKSKFGQTYD